MTEQRKTRSSSKAPAKARAPRKTAQAVRNLRGTVVHLRLYSQSPKDPYRIELKPRGINGDATTIPAKLVDDPTLVSALGVMVEPITQTEFKALQRTYGPVGYLGRDETVVVVSDKDNTVTTADNWDGTGRRAPQERNVQHHERGSEMNQSDREFGTGMHVADVPGSDTALHADLKAQAAAMGGNAVPEGVDLQSRKVTIEHVKGQ